MAFPERRPFKHVVHLSVQGKACSRCRRSLAESSTSISIKPEGRVGIHWTMVSINTIVQWICLHAFGLIKLCIASESTGNEQRTISLRRTHMTLEKMLYTANVQTPVAWR